MMYSVSIQPIEGCFQEDINQIGILDKWIAIKGIYSYEYNGRKEELEDTDFDDSFYMIFRSDGKFETWESGDKEEGIYTMSTDGKTLNTSFLNSENYSRQIRILTSNTLEVYEEGEYDDQNGDGITSNLYRYTSLLTLKRA